MWELIRISNLLKTRAGVNLQPFSGAEMNLKDIRKWFVQESGRYDLVENQDDWTDDGADNYINAAQRWLDRKAEHRKEVARAFAILEPGDYFVFFREVRIITEVWVGNSVAGMWPMHKKSYKELRQIYKEPFQLVSKGAPTYYAPAYIRPANETESTFDGRLDLMDVMVDWKSYNGLFLLPPMNREYQVEIWGKFFAEKLEEDSDESYWTIEDPAILIKACLRELEVFYRNTQGVRDWENAIMSEIQGIQFDRIAEEITGINQMEG